MSLLDRLVAPGPERVLALDGGGIRGVITLGFLARIEALLQARHNRPDLVFADYFDLIGGTSTRPLLWCKQEHPALARGARQHPGITLRHSQIMSSRYFRPKSFSA
jgi:patatin-like phospholipase/acyl hydrolase